MTPAKPRPSHSGTSTRRVSQSSQLVGFSSGAGAGEGGDAAAETASSEVCMLVGRSAVEMDGDDGSESTICVTGARTVITLESATPAAKPMIAGAEVENVPAKASISLTPSINARNASSASEPPPPVRRAPELDADMGTDRRKPRRRRGGSVSE